MSALQSESHISPFLWFNTNAAEAVDFYVSIFPNSRRTGEFRTPACPPDRPMVITFELDGLHFTALNGGPGHTFTPAISFAVRCDTQSEIDRYWDALSVGGHEDRCGWIQDRFGLSWQIVPAQLPQLIRHPKAMQAMLGMKKLSIPELEQAAQQ